MFISAQSCKTRRISSPSDIKLILKNNALIVRSHDGILIGSRAARYFLPHFRGRASDKTTDWNIICAAQFLLDWLAGENESIQTIEMIVPKVKHGYKLDLYVDCTLHDDEARYNFTVPRSSLSHTAYLLDHAATWTVRSFVPPIWAQKHNCLLNATVRLLLILKKSMLLHASQWMKTAQDYRQLITVSDYSTIDDTPLGELVLRSNEQLYGNRSSDVDTFDISPTDTLQERIAIERVEFCQHTKKKRCAIIYHTAICISSTGNLLDGLEHICTQGPRWLAEYALDNWMDIQNEKFEYFHPLTLPQMQFEVGSHCLFQETPEKETQHILQHIETTRDFYNMQFVCKRWHSLLNDESFWQYLYEFRYGIDIRSPELVSSWKLMYFVRLEAGCTEANSPWEQLVGASHRLRQYTATDVYRLWEGLTQQDQHIELPLMSDINFMLSNAVYYQMSETSCQYSAKVIVNGLGGIASQWRVHTIVRIREEGNSRFTDSIEELIIEWTSDKKITRSLTVSGPHLIGFDLGIWGYTPTERRLLTSIPSEFLSRFPSGLIICLVILMVHPNHRPSFINYLKNLETHCREHISEL